MRQIQTLTTRQIAYALAKAEDNVGPNFAPSNFKVDVITDRLDVIATAHGLNPSELRGDQAAIVQDIYVERREAGAYTESALVR